MELKESKKLKTSSLNNIIYTKKQLGNKRYSAKDFGKVAVLLGGTSAERAISLESGQAVLTALKKQGVDAYPVDPKDGLLAAFLDQKYDCAFIILHGTPGEDGTVQGFLETLGIPYTGSGVMASGIAMDKVRSKLLFQAFGLPTPKFGVAFSFEQAQEAAKDLAYPLAVKPISEGSSLGVTRVTAPEFLPKAYEKAAAYGGVLIEEWRDGKDFFVGILGDQVLPSVHVALSKGFYDYDAKYQSNETQYFCPGPLSAEQEKKIQEIAYQAFKSVGAEGWGRIDFVQDAQGDFWVLEVNTLPGMTSHSLLPMEAAELGLSFEDVVMEIMAQMWDKHRNLTMGDIGIGKQA